MSAMRSKNEASIDVRFRYLDLFFVLVSDGLEFVTLLICYILNVEEAHVRLGDLEVVVKELCLDHNVPI